MPYRHIRTLSLEKARVNPNFEYLLRALLPTKVGDFLEFYTKD